MSLRKKLLIAASALVVVAVAAVLAGPSLYASWANGKSEAPPELAADGGSAEPFDVASLKTSWRVGGGSFAGYRVKEVLRGENVTVTGRTDKVEGKLSIGSGRLREASFTVDVADIATPESARDAYFRSSSAMDAERYPQATFSLTKAASIEALGDGREHAVRLTGDLLIHGTRRTETFTAHVQAGPRKAKIIGSIPITFSDFHVKAPSLGFVTVEKHGSVEFSLSATPS